MSNVKGGSEMGERTQETLAREGGLYSDNYFAGVLEFLVTPVFTGPGLPN